MMLRLFRNMLQAIKNFFKKSKRMRLLPPVPVEDGYMAFLPDTGTVVPKEAIPEWKPLDSVTSFKVYQMASGKPAYIENSEIEDCITTLQAQYGRYRRNADLAALKEIAKAPDSKKLIPFISSRDVCIKSIALAISRRERMK